VTGTLTSTARMTVDGGQSWVDVDFAATNQTVHDTLRGTVLNVDATGIVRSGDATVRFAGTFDVFTGLIALRDVLRNEQAMGDNAVQQQLQDLLAELDVGRDAVLGGIQELGGRGERIALLQNRVEMLATTTQSGISRIADTDLVEAIARMNQTDAAYQAALAVTGRILSVSLLNFLR
jgi:flagellar hook-associated protein 3 FlgL